MSTSFQGKVALITGTGGGMGRATARRFAAAGAAVIGCDTNAEENLKTAELIRAEGGTITTMQPVDLGDREQAKNWVKEAAAVHGRIDVLCNIAGACAFGDFETLPVEDWDFTIRNELDLVFIVTQAAWPHLKRQGGVIINIASVAATHVLVFPQTPHNATKGAIVSLTRGLAVEGAPHGIRSVFISPGPIETPSLAAKVAEDPSLREEFVKRNLIKRLGQPDEIAAAALFLASDDAAYITGTGLLIDGGYTAS